MVAFAAAVFKNIDVAIYSAIAIFVSSKMIDTICQGVDYAKVIYTVTERGEAVAALLNERTGRGTTVITAPPESAAPAETGETPAEETPAPAPTEAPAQTASVPVWEILK